MAKIIMYPGETKQEALDWKQTQEQHITAVFKNILVLGSGGREHALAWKLAQSEGVNVFIAPGNAGTAQVGRNLNIKADDFAAIRQCCIKKKIDLVVVGPEQPLVNGIMSDPASTMSHSLAVFRVSLGDSFAILTISCSKNCL